MENNNTNKSSRKQEVLESSNLRLYSIPEAAAVLRVSEKLLRERINNGEIDTIQWGNSRRIPHWHLREWQEKELNKINDAVDKILYPQLSE